MATGSAKVSDPVGLHLRAASLVVKLAQTYPCAIQLSYNGAKANARSILGVAALTAGPGAEIEIVADGDREDEAVAAMVDLIGTRLAEGPTA